jgi:ribonuclease J
VPVHGEFRHLRAHAELAVVMGTAPDHVLQATDGDVLELSDDGLVFADKVPASYLFVDGIVGDVGQGVLRDRRVLAEEGVVVIVATVDSALHKVITGPELITRGWVYAPEADNLLDEAEAHIEKALVQALDDGISDIDSLERIVRKAAGKFVSDRTKRRPMIVPVVMTT